MTLRFVGLDPALEFGLGLVLPLLGLGRGDDGVPVRPRQNGAGLWLARQNGELLLEYGSRTAFFRGLSMLAGLPDGDGPLVEEHPCFNTTGVMLDVSRGGVLTVEAAEALLCRMALMGLNRCLLYMEDVYQVAGEPWFGYLRGRYSHEELHRMDDTAHALGIELIPSIQALGHMGRFLHWPAAAAYRDTNEVLLADSEATYDLLERMLLAASAPFRTRRIHIGMDEAWDMGLGAYQKQHGYADAADIMRRHLGRVLALMEKLGLQPMLWSDMLFRVASQTQNYYDETRPPEDLAQSLPAGLQLVYWDYYHTDKAHYVRNLKKHQALGAAPTFAGGIWVWRGPAPPYDRTLMTSRPALEACRECGVQDVYATLWGDDGTECSLLAGLYGMQLYAEFAWRGGWDDAAVKARFAACTGEDANAFLGLSAFNTAPGVPQPNYEAVNPAKFLFYQDPLLPLFEKDFEGVELEAHYAALAGQYDAYAQSSPSLTLLFGFYAELGRFLALKLRWHQGAGPAVRAGNRQAAVALAQTATAALEQLETLHTAWRTLWQATCKPFGFETIDLRLGGLAARLKWAAQSMAAFAGGTADTIEELAADKLNLLRDEQGGLIQWKDWRDTVSPQKL